MRTFASKPETSRREPRSGLTHGRPLEPQLRHDMEQRFDHDFSAIFGRPSADYRPADPMSNVPISNKEAAMIFDHPELKRLPDDIVPFNY